MGSEKLHFYTTPVGPEKLREVLVQLQSALVSSTESVCGLQLGYFKSQSFMVSRELIVHGIRIFCIVLVTNIPKKVFTMAGCAQKRLGESLWCHL